VWRCCPPTRRGCSAGRRRRSARPSSGAGWWRWGAAAEERGRAPSRRRWRSPPLPACCSSTPTRGAAADLAALAGAQRAVTGDPDPCAAARRLAAANAAQLTRCRARADGTVEVTVVVPVQFGRFGVHEATARARAGPVSPAVGEALPFPASPWHTARHPRPGRRPDGPRCGPKCRPRRRPRRPVPRLSPAVGSSATVTGPPGSPSSGRGHGGAPDRATCGLRRSADAGGLRPAPSAPAR
jgi:secretion/DNA translocation related TadE-like protein